MAVTAKDEERLSANQRDQLQKWTDEYDNNKNDAYWMENVFPTIKEQADYMRAHPEGTDSNGNSYNGYEATREGYYAGDIYDDTPATPPKTQTQINANLNANANGLPYTQDQLNGYINTAVGNALTGINAQLAQLQKTPTAYFTWDDYWKNRDAYINNMQKSPTTYINWDDYWNRLNSYIDEGKQAAINANQAATDKSVVDVNATLQNGLPQYAQVADDAYLKKLAAENNTALNAQAAGDIGGLYQRQYSYADNAYDQQLLGIALEKQNFINQCNQQIDALKAQGRFNEAQLISGWANTRIQMYDQAINNVYSINQNQQQIDQNTVNSYNNLIESMYGINQNQQQIDLNAYQWDKNFAYNKAIELLDKGFVTPESLTDLGVMPSEAQAYADRVNKLKDINLAAAQAELARLLSQTYGTQGALGGGTTPSGTPSITPSTTPITKGTFGFSSGSFDQLQEKFLKESLVNGTLQVTRGDKTFLAKAYDDNSNVVINGSLGWKEGDAVTLSGGENGEGSFVFHNGGFIPFKEYNALVDKQNAVDSRADAIKNWVDLNVKAFGMDQDPTNESGYAYYEEGGAAKLFNDLYSRQQLLKNLLSVENEKANQSGHSIIIDKKLIEYERKISEIQDALDSYKQIVSGK